jgi:hypothetical protein
MKITRRNISKESSAYYVVTRHGRRIEDRNYSSQADAEERAYHLRLMLKEWDPRNSNSVGIVYTSKPYKVF